jgi:uncharacterized protein (DUF1697 family)
VTTHILLFRGINVSGRNRLPMADLRAVVGALGFTDVATYLQSGNLVCTGAGSSSEVAASVAGALASELDLTVPVLGRSANEWAAMVAGNPLVGLDDDPKKLHVTFLDGVPDPQRVRDLTTEAAAFAPERLEVVGADVYLHCPGGYGVTPLSNGFVEKRLGRVATTRNWRTVGALAELAVGG